jgi:RNase P subunit RPR2
MAKRTIIQCDNCQEELADGKQAFMTVQYGKGRKTADLCDKCADQLPGVLAKRRGRKPKESPMP